MATAIVLACIATVVLIHNRPSFGSSGDGPTTPEATGTPSAPRFNGDGRSPLPDNWIARAPWAFSALPGCFEQESMARGSRAFVTAHVPRGAKASPAGSRLSIGECTVHVYRTTVIVERPPATMFVPPLARIYVTDRHIVVTQEHGTFAELRVYRTVEAARSQATSATRECAKLALACL